MKNNRPGYSMTSSFAKFAHGDKQYLSERQKVADEIGRPDLFDFVDHFGLFAGVQTIGRTLAIYEIVKQTLNIPGNVIEFGCWKGSNLLLIAKIIQLLQPNTIREVYGFDSFQGLQTFSSEDDMQQEMTGAYRGNEEILRRFIELYEFEQWVHLVKGDATKTIKEFAEQYTHALVSLAFIDFDLYLPSKEALNFLAKRMSIGGLIVFDEALTHDWKGEGKALLEFLDHNDGKYNTTMIPFVRQPTVILKRVR